MFLIYAYIAKYKNYVGQGVRLDPSYDVNFCDGELSITYLGNSNAYQVLRAGKKPDHLHLVVGKTGSGKTNLLQLIGMKHDMRQRQRNTPRFWPSPSSTHRATLLSTGKTAISTKRLRA